MLPRHSVRDRAGVRSEESLASVVISLAGRGGQPPSCHPEFRGTLHSSFRGEAEESLSKSCQPSVVSRQDVRMWRCTDRVSTRSLIRDPTRSRSRGNRIAWGPTAWRLMA